MSKKGLCAGAHYSDDELLLEMTVQRKLCTAGSTKTDLRAGEH